MMSRGMRAALLAVTMAGWIALGVSMLPWLEGIAPHLGRLGVAVGPTGSIVLALARLTLPVAQVYEAGRQAGRDESGGPGRRRLRVVERD